MKYLIFLLNLIFEVREYSSSIYDKPVPEIIEAYGFPSETHSIFTADDYNLILHRIPYGRHCKKKNSPPVLVMHGLMQSSLSWLSMGPEKALGFLLADDCYDVWLGNDRGNCYSRKHKYLKTSQAKYWDFSWHEMGVYDISATVDYITNVTKQDVLYIGVSQGTTSALINAIYRPEVKIKAYFFLAPIAYFKKSAQPTRALSPAEPLLRFLTQKLFGNFEVGFTNSKISQLVKRIICTILPHVCTLTYSSCGFDILHLNLTAISADVVNLCGISSKQLFHYLQGFYLDFSEYNYGGLDNRRKYGTGSPPKYNVEVINKPVYLYHAESDSCGDLADVERLAKELGSSLAGIHLVDDPNFDHLGFNFNVRVKELVYDVLMSDMREALD